MTFTPLNISLMESIYVHYDKKERNFPREEQNKSMKSFYVHYLLLQLDIHDNYDLILQPSECKGNYP